MFRLNQLASQFRGIAFRLPIELRDKLDGTDIRRGIPMAIQAPGHGERLNLLHLDHLIDAAVAGDAADARR